MPLHTWVDVFVGHAGGLARVIETETKSKNCEWIYLG